MRNRPMKKLMSSVSWSPYQVAIHARSKREAWQKLFQMYPHLDEQTLRQRAQIH